MNNINEKILDSLKLFDLQELYEINKSMGNFFCYIETYEDSYSRSSSDDEVKYDKENGSEEKMDDIKKSLGWCLWFLNLLSKYRVKYVHPYHLTFQGEVTESNGSFSKENKPHFYISISLEIWKSIEFHFFDNKVNVLLSYYSKENPPKIYSKTFDFNQIKDSEKLQDNFDKDNFTKISCDFLTYINPYLLDVKYCNLPLDTSKDEKELFVFYEINYKSLDEFYIFFTKYIIEKFDDLMREKQNKKK